VGESVKTMQNEDEQPEREIDDVKDKKKRVPPQFIPKLLNQTIMVRMVDGRPIKGTLEGFNNYELELSLGKGKKVILFKGAIASIEY
jgi:hypothetical protein